MKKYGKVIQFDGYFGKIRSQDQNEYIILASELIENIKVNDIVIFEPEVYHDQELSKNIARFIRLLDK